MDKLSSGNSRHKMLNPVFHVQLQNEDDSKLSEALIKSVRKTGQLNLSGLGLASVPTQMLSMYENDVDKDLDISKTPEDPWWQFSPLTHLDLSSNVIQTLPPGIVLFGDLTTLNLHDNCLKELPAGIGGFNKLTMLNVSRNNITILPEELCRLSELRQLFIAHNKLENLTGDIGDLVMLEVLDLSNNSLTTLPPSISFLIRLVELNVADNNLVELPPEMTGMRSLSKLIVTNNKLKYVPELSYMHKLQIIYAQRNSILALPIFVHSENLQELHFGSNNIKEVTKDFCDNMAHLKVLDLGDNEIAILPNEIAFCQSLIRLNLTNNQLQNLPYSLGLLPHLQCLQVEGNILKHMRSDIIKTGTLRMIKHLREKFDEESEYQIRDNSLYLNVIQFPDRHALTRTRFLSLGMRNLTGIPDSVFEDSQFAEVNIVDLCKNQLTAVPEGLVLLKNKLTELNLSANKLKIIPDFLSACTSLHFLDVSKNALRDLPDGMGNLKRMREIIISNNKFQSIPECIYELKGLEVLNATDNMISEIDVSNLKKLKRLATLALTNNNINFVPPELGTLTHLRSLELVGNSFRQPRYTVLEQGTESILSYLRNRIQQ